MTPFETDVAILAAAFVFIAGASMAEAAERAWARRKARRRLRSLRRWSLQGGRR